MFLRWDYSGYRWENNCYLNYSENFKSKFLIRAKFDVDHCSIFVMIISVSINKVGLFEVNSCKCLLPTKFFKPSKFKWKRTVFVIYQVEVRRLLSCPNSSLSHYSCLFFFPRWVLNLYIHFTLKTVCLHREKKNTWESAKMNQFLVLTSSVNSDIVSKNGCTFLSYFQFTSYF